METLERIYGALDLGEFEVQKPRLETYLDSLANYEKNSFDFPPDVIETVNANWGFAFDAFGYERKEVKASGS